MATIQLGRLRARLVGGDDGQGGGAGPVVVLLHGYGAPGDDLVPLARFLQLPARARLLFPEAPLALDYGSRAWWPLDPELFERRARGERIDRSDELPPTLGDVRAQLDELLDEAAERLQAPRARMILGGFSQGSMLACDVALHATAKPAGLVLLSSTLIARPQWEPRMASCAGLPILQTHGKQDPLLAYEDAVALRDLWRQNGADVTFVDFEGGHELPLIVLHALQRFLAAHAR